MADIFLSYSREDSGRADAMVQALKAVGWSVWFDRYTPTARKWANILESELERARCVVMLWSDHAMDSDWVRKEGIAGLDRAVLVPVRIRESDIPDVFGSIQFADLTSWDGDPAAPAFTELVQSIRNQMLPHCRMRFDSLFEPRLDDLKDLYEAYLHVTERLGCVPALGRFQDPSTPDGQRRLHRAVASLQVSIEWDSTLSNWFANSPARETILERIGRIERHIPLIWLRLLSYSGPFFSSVSSPRTHANFLSFASMMFFHEMFGTLRLVGQHMGIPSPLTAAQLSFPRWEGTISAFFEDSDEIAMAYVTHIDNSPLRTEEVFYGPKYRSQIAYGRSLRNFPFTEPVWLERYVVPQRELRLAVEGSTQHTVYGGNARIRKVTDLNGNDLPPLFDV